MRLDIPIPQKTWKIRRPWVCRYPKTVSFDPPSAGDPNAFAPRFRIRRTVDHDLHLANAGDDIAVVVRNASRSQPHDRFGVQLACSRLGDTEHLADLAKCVVLLVVQLEQ